MIVDRIYTRGQLRRRMTVDERIALRKAVLDDYEEGLSYSAIAARNRVSSETVKKWCESARQQA